MIYNHAPDWVFACKTIGSTSKLVFERMYSMSKDCTIEVYVRRQHMADTLGISLPSITKAFKELTELGVIVEVENDNSWNRTKKFKITCSDSDCERQSNNLTIDNKETLRHSKETLQPSLNNFTTHSKESLLSSLDRNIERNSKKERESKRSASASLSYSFDDIFVLFTQKANELKKDHLAIERMYLPTIAEKFFNFWSKKKFKFNLGLDGNITKWLLDECAHIESNLLRDTKSEQLAEQQQRADKTNEWIEREAEIKGITPEEVRQQFLDYYHAAINGPTDEQKLLSDFLGVSVDKLTHNQGVVINEH